MAPLSKKSTYLRLGGRCALCGKEFTKKKAVLHSLTKNGPRTITCKKCSHRMGRYMKIVVHKAPYS